MPAERATQAADTRWRPAARCRDKDPEIFFTDSDESRKYAKAICAGCPVRVDCLGYALQKETALGTSLGHRHGVWGGLSAYERWELACPEQAEARRRKTEEYCQRPKAREQKRMAERARRSRKRLAAQEDAA